jgi:hypothetical protein
MFAAGKSGNPTGRPKGALGGRARALAGLDKMLAQRKNVDVLVKALEEEFRADPVRFFKTVVMPLLPRDAKGEVDRGGGIIRWRSLLELEGENGKNEELG